MEISFKEQLGYNHRIPVKYGGYTMAYAYGIFYQYIDKKPWAFKVRERRREGRGPDKIYLTSFGWNLLQKIFDMKKEKRSSKEIEVEIQSIISLQFPEFAMCSSNNTPTKTLSNIPTISYEEHKKLILLEGIKKLQEGLEILSKSLESNMKISENEIKMKGEKINNV